MRITLKVICKEFLNDLPSGEYCIADPAPGREYSVAETFALCALSCEAGPLSEKQLARPMYVLGGKNVQRTAAVHDGDVIMAVRPVVGG